MNQMQQYHDYLNKIMNDGIDIYNKRTKSVCKTIIGGQMEFNIENDFPVLTTRKLPFKNIVGELLGFFRGYTSAKDFRDLGCNFWNANANETEAWLNNFYRKGEDDCGNIYGKQWTNWETLRLADSFDEEKYLVDNDWEFVDDTDLGYSVYKKSINQLENAVKTILTNPSDRRIIVSGWNIGEFDKMSLPPCHCTYMFIPDEERKVMHVVMWQRSCDFFLGIPANIASTSLFLSVMARLTGYTPGKVILQMANLHLYENQYEVTKELLNREHFDCPKLILSDNIKKIENLEDINGCFTRINPEDIYLDKYVEGENCHSPLTVKMMS